MPKKPGSMSYARQEYVHSKPQVKVTRFTLGNPNLDYEYVVTLVAEKAAEIRGSALEAARVTANKILTLATGQSFLIRVVVYPHEIVRAHKFMGFAGADRLSQGMQHAFGRPTERMAKVTTEQPIIAVHTMGTGLESAKEALKRASKKLPLPSKVMVIPLKKVEAD